MALTVAASTLTFAPAHAAGDFTAVFGASNPLAVLGSYHFGTAVTADIDADGDLDIVVREPSGNTTIDVLRNDGGTFTVLTGAASPFAGISFAASPFNFVNTRVLVGDFDADGDVDLWHHGDTVTAFYRNDGGTFSQHVGSADPLHALGLRDPGTYVVADVDGDSDPDVVVREPVGDATLELFRNDQGTFTITTAPFSAVSFPPDAGNFLNLHVLVLDADRDGDLDLWHHGPHGAALLRNDGGTFTALSGGDDPLHELAPYDKGTYVVVDVDSDGDADVAAREPSAGTTVDVLRNDGGTFTRLTGAASPFAAAPLVWIDWNTQHLLAADLDGDGDADVYNHAEARLFRQAGSAPRALGRTPARGAVDVPVSSTLTLTFDEAVDLGHGHVVLRDASDNTVVERLSVTTDAARFAGVGTPTISITPRSPLPFATTITVAVEPAAFVSSTDGDAFAGLDPITWRFTTASNTPPSLSHIDGDAVIFVEDGGPVALDHGAPLGVGDADGIGFAGGTLSVAVTGGAVATEDRLLHAPAEHLGAVTASAASISIALGAGADAAALTTWLRSIAYTNDGGDDPTPGTRTVEIALHDSGGLGAHATVSVTVVAVNDPPTISAPSGLIVAAGAVVPITDVVVTDVDSDLVQLRGELDAGTFADGHTTLQHTGQPADINARVAAESLTWHAPLIARHGRLRLTVDDGQATVSTEVALQVIALPSRPPSSPGPTPGIVREVPVALPTVPWTDPITAAVERSRAATPDGEHGAHGPDTDAAAPSDQVADRTDDGATTSASRRGGAAADGHAGRANDRGRDRTPPWTALGAVFLAAVFVLLLLHRRRDDERRRLAR